MEHDRRSASEEEYFKRQELERKKKWAAEQEEKLAAEEKARLKELHYMKCPKCGMDLTEMEVHGVTVDRCMSCNGTWFDEGEVEQLTKKGGGDLLAKVTSFFK
jgi:uncharacterized protein